jgi:Fe-S cluster assembly protein SufB
MSQDEILDGVTTSEYKYGFTTEFESDNLPPGLDEGVIRALSAKKNEPEWLTDWRLEAFRIWQEMTEPEWANVHYKKPDYQAISYYSAPVKKQVDSLDDIDPELLDSPWPPEAEPQRVMRDLSKLMRASGFWDTPGR